MRRADKIGMEERESSRQLGMLLQLWSFVRPYRLQVLAASLGVVTPFCSCSARCLNFGYISVYS